MKKEEAQKRIKRNKGRHRQKYTTNALFGGKPGCFLAKPKTRKPPKKNKKDK